MWQINWLTDCLKESTPDVVSWCHARQENVQHWKDKKNTRVMYCYQAIWNVQWLTWNDNPSDTQHKWIPPQWNFSALISHRCFTQQFSLACRKWFVFAFVLHYDANRLAHKLTPLWNPIRSKTKTTRDSHIHFPAFHVRRRHLFVLILDCLCCL